MKKPLPTKLIVLFFTITSCSTYRPPEAFEAKMNRFEGTSEVANIVPKIYPQPLLLQERSPASITPYGKNIKPVNISDKKLYFTGLYSQYKQLRDFGSSTTPIINSCPHFHSVIVEDKEKKNHFSFIIPKGAEFEKLSNLYKEAKNNPGLYPELHLPTDKNNSYNTVFSNIKNDQKIDQIPYQIQLAINIHLEKTFGELKELCETGSSTNFYIYENLTNYQKMKNMKKNENTLISFLKTTLVANLAILTSLEAWAKNQNNLINDPVNFEILKRLKGVWFGDYLSHLVKKRRNLASIENNKADRD